jgi:catechol 2,3-dioxygenase-like lactoylglutathione lyase family enzyme
VTKKVVPMINVPDVAAATAWYESIGFIVERTHADDGVISWALLTFGDDELMFNEGGQPSSASRREVDLYVQVDDVEEVYQRLRDRVEIVEEPHDVVYGMRELIIRDLNRFWITFGQPLQPK